MLCVLHLFLFQLKVLPRDLQLCSETASGVDAGGQHEWGELVQLDPQTVGVIVRLERETFQVKFKRMGQVQAKFSSSHLLDVSSQQ